jgi:hypothetical protein
VLVAPSPNAQLHDVGSPADASVNCTICPTTGVVGANAKDELSTDMEATVSVLLACLEPVLVVATKPTT